MYKTAFAMVVILAIFFCFGRANSNAPAEKPVQKWEYGEYGDFNGTSSWISPDGVIENKDFEKFHLMLGGKGATKNGLIDIMNDVGAMGWEFCHHEVKSDTYYFRRPVR